MFEDLQNLWAGLAFIFAAISAFFVWLRSLLRQRPPMAEFRARGNSFWRSLWAKLTFIKTKLLAGLLMIASAIVAVHDFLLPIFITIDWSPLTGRVPSWAWPIISFTVLALFYWLRTITARETNQIVAAVEAGNTPQEAVMLVATGEAPLPNMVQKVT